MTAPATTADQALRTDTVDVSVGGLATIRVVGHRAEDLAAIEAQFGPGRAPGQGAPDLTVRYVDAIETRGRLSYLGPGELGFDDDGLMVLQGRFRRSVRVRLPLDDLGGPCEILCEHGVGRVPHLVALVNLAVLRKGGLALHASAWEDDGTATVATGWSKGGKSEALLAFCSRGARYVGDEWLHLHPDLLVSGIEEPIRVWDWYFDQVPQGRSRLSARDRRRLTVLRAAARTIDVAGRSARLGTAIRRQRFVDVDPSVIALHHRVVEPVPLGRIFLMTSAEQRATTVHPLSGHEIAERMAGSLSFERAPLRGLVDAYRYAFPRRVTRALDDVDELERERLHALLDDLDAAEVRHPYPADLNELAKTMNAYVRAMR